MDEINILRNRTFNDELRTLVEKVSSNEKKPGSVNPVLNRKELVHAFHRLFYEAKNLNDYSFIYSGADLYPPGDQTEFNPGICIAEYLKNTGHKVYAIFDYQIENECFEITLSTIDEVNASKIVIGLYDNLFKNIIASENGSVLTADDIKSDKFLFKKFSGLLEDAGTHSLYFISFSHLTEKIQTIYNIKKFTSYCSPILMIKLDYIPVPGEQIKLRKELDKNISIPAFIFNDRASIQFAWPSFQNMLYYIDYFHSIYSFSGGSSAFIIRTVKYNSRDILLSMKYLYSRFYKTLGNESVIFRVSVSSIIIITINQMIPVLEEIIKDWNVIYENAFTTEIRSITDMEENDIILRDFFT